MLVFYRVHPQGVHDAPKFEAFGSLEYNESSGWRVRVNTDEDERTIQGFMTARSPNDLSARDEPVEWMKDITPYSSGPLAVRWVDG